MSRVRKRESARRDLIAQWVWYAENAGIETADRSLTQPNPLQLCWLHEVKGMRRVPVTDGFESILLFYFRGRTELILFGRPLFIWEQAG